jgi:hypothetical protein
MISRSSKTFTITSQPYYDQYNQCYKNILTVNIEPQGPIRKIVRQIKFPKLSPFQRESPCNPIPKCGLALHSIYNDGCNGLMTPNEIPDLISFLIENGYQIETQLTNMLNQSEVKLSDKKIAFTVTYYGEKTPNITYMR